LKPLIAILPDAFLYVKHKLYLLGIEQVRVPKKHLTYMHKWCICLHMRTTLNIDDKILEDASRLTGIKEKTALVRLGLEALIARESGKRLARLGGTEKKLNRIPRRRPGKL